MSSALAVGADGTSVRELLARATATLCAAGCETPRLDAEVLLAHVSGSSRAELLSGPQAHVHASRERAFAAVLRRRAQEREPVAYITRRRAFRHLELEVDPRVLIPRPETEELVEAGLALSAGRRVLDLGTGSGAVALALKSERPDLTVAASDICAGALALARANATRERLDVGLMRGDLLLGVPDEFDAVLCNPPYVAEPERSSLALEILRHEPARALFAGADGLDVIRRLAEELRVRTRVRFLALEIGAGQARAVRDLFCAAGFGSLRFARDLAGIERVLVATRGV